MTITTSLSNRLSLDQPKYRVLVALIILVVSAYPSYQLVLMDIRRTTPNTRILAREWIVENLPPGSPIVQEGYIPLLAGTNFDVQEFPYLATSGYTLEDAHRLGIRYVVVSGEIYGRYMAEPDRYPSEIAFYQKLFAEGHLLQQFKPSATRGGPVIRIYELPEAAR
jgi:hypothetical protein